MFIHSTFDMKKLVATVGALCVLCVVGSIELVAQTYSPFQFIRTTYSARTSALGESTVAALDDASNVALNPASAYAAPTGRLAATFIKQVADISSGMVSYVGSAGSQAKWSALVCYQSYGSFTGKNDQGQPTGKTYNPSSVALAASYSNEIDSGFYYGVGLQVMTSSLADQGTSAMALSAGLLYHVPNSRWNVGLALTNLGTQLSTINSVKEPLPTDLRLGVNHRLRGLPLLVNFSFNHLVDQNTALFDHFRNFSIGGELYVGKIIELRLGYNNTAHSGAAFPVNSQFAGLNFGVGIKLKPLNIDYGLSSLVSGVMQHRVSVLTSL